MQKIENVAITVYILINRARVAMRAVIQVKNELAHI